tara:strand:- start:1296 stop:1637 length:342 start_codon:yes stop_codon:yes gene_type:complete
MAIYSNLLVDQGSTFRANVDVTDSDGNELNLTNYTVAAQLRKNYSSTTAVEFTATISNATSGVLEIFLSDTQTDLLKAGRYVYDVEITSPGGEVTRVLEGQIEVSPGVTRVII